MAENPQFGSSFDDLVGDGVIYEEATTRTMECILKSQKQRLRYLLRNLKAEHKRDEVDWGPPKGKEVW